VPNLLKRILLLLLFAAVFPLVTPPGTVWVGIPVALGQEDDSNFVEDEDVPPGIASGWIVGHRLLEEGNSADALPYLHMAYRAHPDVIVIAMDFQTALASEGYLRDAINVMDTLVAAYPDSQTFLLRRSALNLSSGKSDKALEDLRTIRRQGNASVEVLAAEASILASDGKTGQALDVLRDGLHLHPDRGRDIYLEMARILRQADETGAIPGLMDEALVEFPDEPMLWLVKIRSLAALSRPTEARAAAQEADHHFSTLPAAPGSDLPDDPSLMESTAGTHQYPGLPNDSFAVELADYYAQNNQIDQALAILKPLSDQGELALTPSLWLGRLLLGSGREEEGVELVERILAQWPASGRGWYLRGKVDEGSGDWEKAIPHYRRAVELDPYDPEIRLGILRAMLIAWERDLRSEIPDSTQEKKIVEFRDHAMVASTLVPEMDSEGQMMLGYSFRALKDLDRAAWRFELAAENPDLRLTALIQKSISHDENGEFAKARSALELLRQEYPKDPEVANSFGYFLAEKGQDLDLAEDLIREALSSDPGNGAYLDSLGWVMYRNGRFEESFDYLIQAVNVLPDDPVILEHLGIVLMNLEQNAEALDVLERALNLGGDSERISALISTVKSTLQEKE
jgi:tetratricopeptide (TPR) repeat protein